MRVFGCVSLGVCTSMESMCVFGFMCLWGACREVESSVV